MRVPGLGFLTAAKKTDFWGRFQYGPMRKVVLYFAILGLTTDWLSAQILDTIVIGNRVWMAKDLNVSHFANGDSISKAQELSKWKFAATLASIGHRKYAGSWCNYSSDYVDGGGKLYNWYAVSDPRGLCPVGWHVATASDWNLFQEERNKAFIEKLEIEAIRDSIVSHPAVYKKETYFFETGGYSSVINCPNCKSWSEEYMKKVPCHTCKDNRTVSGPYIPKTKQKGERDVLVSRAWEETIHKERPPIPFIPELNLYNKQFRKSNGMYVNASKWWIGGVEPELWDKENLVLEKLTSTKGERIKHPKSESYDPATGSLGEREKAEKLSPDEGHPVRCVKGESIQNFQIGQPEISKDSLPNFTMELTTSKNKVISSNILFQNRKWKCVIVGGYKQEFYILGDHLERLSQNKDSLDFIMILNYDNWPEWKSGLYGTTPQNDSQVSITKMINQDSDRPIGRWKPLIGWKETLAFLESSVFYNNNVQVANENFYYLVSPKGKIYLKEYGISGLEKIMQNVELLSKLE